MDGFRHYGRALLAGIIVALLAQGAVNVATWVVPSGEWLLQDPDFKLAVTFSVLGYFVGMAKAEHRSQRA